MSKAKYEEYVGMGERLRYYRSKKSLSIMDLAAKVGVSYGTIHRLETSDHASMYTIRAILENTKINPSYLKEGTGSMEIEKMEQADFEDTDLFTKAFQYFYDTFDVTEDELFVLNHFLLQEPETRKEFFRAYAGLLKKSGTTLSHIVLPPRR